MKLFGLANLIIWFLVLFSAAIMFDFMGAREGARVAIQWQSDAVDSLEVYGDKITEAKEKVGK